jgi:hypothetical protein
LKESSDFIHHNIFLPVLLPDKDHFITDNQPIMNSDFNFPYACLWDGSTGTVEALGGVPT